MNCIVTFLKEGVSSLGGGIPWHTQILADQLTLSQPGGVDYTHQIILALPDFQTFLRPWKVHTVHTYMYIVLK